MANIKSSKKHIKTSKKRKIQNTSKRSTIKTFIKKVRNSINNNNKIEALHFFKIFQSLIDKHITKGLMHKNKGSRYKSSLNTQIMQLK
ncbi:30S ribosomal protein S20 [Buchnera aphidicola (Nipponaphis monzeni)]|uniref:Small ribosomal subunit protein bS20 n=1 Tax=Buchnera aphidicola (Nipponaphis monzeni) TaxID=2495405 RepID=A0A455T9X6_9GAMM|nr:30S ribosomal protein S20 [Buchnera aphidicola]BBI01134.1 30S ribosomal protein S20 [Buchnera aphidicola (Nipponaphis monzeni)]